jgi:LysM repeat protein
MVEDGNVEDEFWSNVPDRRLDRFRAARRRPPATPRPAARPAGTRSHGDHTGSIPVVVPVAAPVTDAVRTVTGHVDPLLRRVGVLAIVVALLVPVALALRSSDPDTTAPADAAAASSVADTQADAASAETTDPWANIDVNALPPAVPVNPDPATADTDASTTAGDRQAEATAAASTAAAATVPKVAQPQAKTSTASACAMKYTIVSGDAWILIADRANVSLKSLLAANNATTSTALYPGRSVCLPAGATMPKAVTTTTKPAAKAPTTTAPKPTTTTAAPKPTKTYTKAQVVQIIREIWPDHLEDKAIAIATRESNLTPAVRNYCCFGLFQIYYKVHKTWLATLGITTAEQLYDPRVNAYAAYVMYLRSGGWGPWAL